MIVEKRHDALGWVLVAVLALSSTALLASEPAGDAVVVSQGQTKLTLADIDAYAERIPPVDRGGFFDNAKRLDSTLKGMLVNRTLAAEARELGLDKDPMVQRQIELATEEALTKARMARFRDSVQMPDFSALAKEKYLANKDGYRKAEVIDVRHILISTADHPADEAKKIAGQVRAKAVANPAGFEALVSEYSDDPSKADNGGLMKDATGGRFVAEFAEGAKALAKVGDISPPVKTQFGYHILYLVAKQPARLPTYADVAPGIISQLSNDYVHDQVSAHLGKAQAAPIESNAELVGSLRTRYITKKKGTDSAEALTP